MAGPGRRQGGRVVEVREEAPGVYRVVVEDGEGRRVLHVSARDGVIETPWGAYPVSELRRSRGGGRRRGGLDWLVETGPGGVVRARLPVRVVEALAKPGEVVDEGATVVVVETMKMLNEVRSPCRGRVVEVAEPGSGVDAGGVLFRVECLEG